MSNRNLQNLYGKNFKRISILIRLTKATESTLKMIGNFIGHMPKQKFALKSLPSLSKAKLKYLKGNIITELTGSELS